MPNRKIVKPLNPLIFKVAGEFAAVYYETGRSQGLTSKWKTPRAFARDNLEKFVPAVIEHFLTMLGPTSNLPELAKAEIYSALIDPINDPDLMDGTSQLSNINAKKLDDIVKEHERYNKDKLGMVNTVVEKQDTVLHNKVMPTSKPNPFKVTH